MGVDCNRNAHRLRIVSSHEPFCYRHTAVTGNEGIIILDPMALAKKPSIGVTTLAMNPSMNSRKRQGFTRRIVVVAMAAEQEIALGPADTVEKCQFAAAIPCI